MNPSAARNVLRWASGDPRNIEVGLKSLLSDVGEVAPSVMSVAGAYLLSEILSRKVGEKVEKVSASGEQIEPPENYLSWQKEMAIQEADRQKKAIIKKASVYEGFDEDLWIGGIEEGAFAGEKDADAKWYLLEDGGQKVALASAVPGPGELVTISYFVHPDHRSHGYGTKLASRVTDLHEKATFTIFKDNDASIKVALAALKGKFSMTMGHNVVRLTKEAEEEPEKPKRPGMNPAMIADDVVMAVGKAFKARKMAASKKKVEEPKAEEPGMPSPPLISYLDDVAMILKGLRKEGPALAETALKAANGKKDLKDTIGTALESSVHESFTTTADRLLRAGLLSTHERIALSGAVGKSLGQLRKGIHHDVHTRQLTQNAHEHLKAATLRTTAERALQSRTLQSVLAIKKPKHDFMKMRGVESAARVVQSQPSEELSKVDRRQLLMKIRGLKRMTGRAKGGEIYRDIAAAEAAKPQKELTFR